MDLGGEQILFVQLQGSWLVTATPSHWAAAGLSAPLPLELCDERGIPALLRKIPNFSTKVNI